MIKNVLCGLQGIDLYGIASICLFFVVFIGALVWAAVLQKPFLKNMSNLPLQDGSITPEVKKGDSHE